MTILYTVDYARSTEYLRNYDLIEQYFSLVPHNDTSRQIMKPLEYLIDFDNFLLPFNIPTQMVKLLTVTKYFSLHL